MSNLSWMSIDIVKDILRERLEQRDRIDEDIAQCNKIIADYRQEELRQYFVKHHGIDKNQRFNITDEYRTYYDQHHIGWSLRNDNYVTVYAFVDEHRVAIEFETGGATTMNINDFEKLFIGDENNG